jgi:hypothetical protein
VNVSFGGNRRNINFLEDMLLHELGHVVDHQAWFYDQRARLGDFYWSDSHLAAPGARDRREDFTNAFQAWTSRRMGRNDLRYNYNGP